jgi:hypothetical protein
MKRNIVTLTLIGLFLAVALAVAVNLLSPSAGADVDAVSAANQLYAVGHYGEAGKIYEQLIAQGVQDSVVFFNLGNAYYQQGHLGHAILNYERAARLAPRDGDIRANLELARAQAVDLFPEAAAGPINSVASATSNWLTLNETAVLALGLWFVFGFLLLAWRQLQPGLAHTGVKYAMVVTAVVLVLTGVALGSRLYAEHTDSNGIVVTETVALSNGPQEGRATDFSLHSGTRVKISDTSGDWVRLEVPGDALEGWIPRETVEMIAGTSPSM